MREHESIRQALGIETGEHPSYDMLEQVVDGTADDVTREIVESHAEVCASCEADLRDLKQLAGQAGVPVLHWAAAAVLLVAIGAGIYLWLRPRHATPVVVEKPTAKPRGVAASGYGRLDWDAAVRDALARGTIEAPPILRELRPPREVLRDPAGKPESVSLRPAGVVIESTTPALTWAGIDGAVRVSVFDGFERVARSEVLRTSQWRVPVPLTRGKTYTWQIAVRRGGAEEILPAPPSPPALFHVLDEDGAQALAEARRRFPDDSLLQGILHARLGMQDEAVEHLRAHARRHPDAAPLADAVANW